MIRILPQPFLSAILTDGISICSLARGTVALRTSNCEFAVSSWPVVSDVARAPVVLPYFTSADTFWPASWRAFSKRVLQPSARSFSASGTDAARADAQETHSTKFTSAIIECANLQELQALVGKRRLNHADVIAAYITLSRIGRQAADQRSLHVFRAKLAGTAQRTMSLPTPRGLANGLATMLCALAKLQPLLQQEQTLADTLVHKLTADGAQMLRTLRPSKISSVAWALGRLDWANDVVITQLCAVIADIVPVWHISLAPQTLSRLAWGIATLQQHKSTAGRRGPVGEHSMHSRISQAMQAILAAAIPQLSAFTLNDLSHLVWAMSSMRVVTTTGKDLLSEAVEAAAPQLASCDAQSLARIAWYVTRAGYQPDSFMDALSHAALPQLDSFTPQGMTSLAYAFSKSNRDRSDVVRAIMQAAQPRLRSFSASQVSNLLENCLASRYTDKVFLESCSRALAAQPPSSFTPGLCTDALAVLGHLRHYDEAVVPLLLQHVTTHMPELDARAVSRCCQAISMLRHYDPKFLEAAAAHAERCGAGIEDVLSVVMACVKFRYPNPALEQMVKDAHQLKSYNARMLCRVLHVLNVLQARGAVMGGVIGLSGAAHRIVLEPACAEILLELGSRGTEEVLGYQGPVRVLRTWQLLQVCKPGMVHDATVTQLVEQCSQAVTGLHFGESQAALVQSVSSALTATRVEILPTQATAPSIVCSHIHVSGAGLCSPTVVQVVGRDGSCVNQPQRLLGEVQLCYELYRLAGYEVVQVPAFEWDGLQEEARMQYLTARLQQRVPSDPIG